MVMASLPPVKLRRQSSRKCSDDDDILDPRVRDELENLNIFTDTINKLELELDEARAAFRQVLTESTQKLNVLAKKLGSCIDKARPYYDARMKAKEAQVETQKAAVRFEKASSMHAAAVEMVMLSEQGVEKHGGQFDPTWQEMLNYATMKVNQAEREKLESEQEHRKKSRTYNDAEQKVNELQKELKRSISKSSLSTRRSLLQLNNLVRLHHLQLLPYFETKSHFNERLETHKSQVRKLEDDVVAAKCNYAGALHNLEAISEEIHMQRKLQMERLALGERSAGVGAETPPPPPCAVSDKSPSPEESMEEVLSPAATEVTLAALSLSPRGSDLPQESVSTTEAVGASAAVTPEKAAALLNKLTRRRSQVTFDVRTDLANIREDLVYLEDELYPNRGRRRTQSFMQRESATSAADVRRRRETIAAYTESIREAAQGSIPSIPVFLPPSRSDSDMSKHYRLHVEPKETPSEEDSPQCPSCSGVKPQTLSVSQNTSSSASPSLWLGQGTPTHPQTLQEAAKTDEKLAENSSATGEGSTHSDSESLASCDLLDDKQLENLRANIEEFVEIALSET